MEPSAVRIFAQVYGAATMPAGQFAPKAAIPTAVVLTRNCGVSNDAPTKKLLGREALTFPPRQGRSHRRFHWFCRSGTPAR